MYTYSPDRWQRCHWQTASRYYVAEVTQDLFGQWLVRRCWGSRTSARGNEQHLSAANYEAAERLLDATAKRRRARGYHDVTVTLST